MPHGSKDGRTGWKIQICFIGTPNTVLKCSKMDIERPTKLAGEESETEKIPSLMCLLKLSLH